jgi:ubiquinone/menaquinone biosynthesis C-methylase UbiE
MAPVSPETARYDEVAEWYDATLSGDSAAARMPRERALRLLGPPRGSLLDIGCGGGSHTAAFAAAGWEPVGIDISRVQLQLARERGCNVVLGRAESLPFDDASFDGAVSIWTHTDIDAWPAALREARRVVRPGCPFVYLGVHPCFVGPHSLYLEANGVPQFHAGYYRRSGRYEAGPGISPAGLRGKVGATHLPLGEFLQAFVDAGFVFEQVEEPGWRDYPVAIAVRCR